MGTLSQPCTHTKAASAVGDMQAVRQCRGLELHATNVQHICCASFINTANCIDQRAAWHADMWSGHCLVCCCVSYCCMPYCCYMLRLCVPRRCMSRCCTPYCWMLCCCEGHLGQVAFPVPLYPFCAAYGNQGLPYTPLSDCMLDSTLLESTTGLQ